MYTVSNFTESFRYKNDVFEQVSGTCQAINDILLHSQNSETINIVRNIIERYVKITNSYIDGGGYDFTVSDMPKYLAKELKNKASEVNQAYKQRMKHEKKNDPGKDLYNSLKNTREL